LIQRKINPSGLGPQLTPFFAPVKQPSAPLTHFFSLPPQKIMAISHVSDASFDSDVIHSSTPVLVDYWAEWCGPCKRIAPVLEELSAEYGDKLKIAKVDVDANQETQAKYNIKGIPTLMLFKNGEVLGTKVGLMSKRELAAFIDSHV
jgi:thioredoxin 1